jgi:hypothetical protein
MREQDIRRILREVCDSIDRTRSSAGTIAVGVAIALGGQGCAASPPMTYYMGPFPTPADSTTAPGDSALDAASDAAASPSDSATSSVASSSDTGATAPDTGPSMVAKYMAVFDSGPVHKYGVPRPQPEAPVMRYGVPPNERF